MFFGLNVFIVYNKGLGTKLGERMVGEHLAGQFCNGLPALALVLWNFILFYLV